MHLFPAYVNFQVSLSSPLLVPFVELLETLCSTPGGAVRVYQLLLRSREFKWEKIFGYTSILVIRFSVCALFLASCTGSRYLNHMSYFPGLLSLFVSPSNRLLRRFHQIFRPAPPRRTPIPSKENVSVASTLIMQPQSCWKSCVLFTVLI